MSVVRSVFAFLSISAGAAYAADPTWSRDVSRIVQEKCQSCHRPGDIAPFSLLTYQDAAARGTSIRTQVARGIMPPWKPVAGHGEFKGNRSLTDVQRQTILDWVNAGMPEGDPADLPQPLTFANEWRLGPPDQIIAMPEAYKPVARDDHPDRYRCFVVQNVTDSDKWVKAVDVQPGARDLVHHVLLFLTDDASQLRLVAEMEKEDPEPGYDCWGGPRITPGAGPGLVKIVGGLLGGWAPGTETRALPPEHGILLPKGTAVVIQVHYNLGHGREDDVKHEDEPRSDQTRVGVYFHEKTPKTRLLTLPILEDKFVLEPGVMGKEVTAEFPIDLAPVAGFSLPEFLLPKFSAVAVAPHMHQLGRKFRADMVQPDGKQVPLIRIDDWDFHWQGFYDYSAPLPMPYKSTLKLSCTFDNTTTRTVRWGESTEDEMCLLYLGFIAEGGLGALFGNPQ